jgi:thiamine pyrophosphate-dependent acetolactate synthase large subunit-like protein
VLDLIVSDIDTSQYQRIDSTVDDVNSFVYAAVRTPFGKFNGGLAGVRADDLGGAAIASVLARTPGLDPAAIGDIVWGNANGAGEDNRNVGRMAALLAGLPVSVPATSVNRLCGSSLDAVMAGSRTIETGDADVVLALGAELSDVDTVRWRTPGPDARIIAVHADAGKIDRRLPATLGVVADIEEFLHAVVPAAAQRGIATPGAWRERAAAVDRRNGPVGAPADVDAPPLDALLIARAIEAAPDDWVVACDPGFGPLTLSAPAEFGRTRFLYAYGLGAMGFAVPSAIGAVHADGVAGGLAVIGDGSLFMSLSSLESISSLDVPVVVLVIDDGGFGSQRKKQQEAYGRNVGVDYENPDIAAIAAAMGIEASWINSPDDVLSLCDSLPGRAHGAVAVVRRTGEPEGTWYEGSVRRR